MGDRAESGPRPRRTAPWRCPPRVGVPGHAPHWSTRIGQRGRGERGNLLPSGRVSERQTGHRSTNSGRRSTTCHRSEGGPSLRLPQGPPAERAAGLSAATAAACGERGRGTFRRRGAAAHPPLPLEAHYYPPRAAGIRDLKRARESRDLRARSARPGRVRAPKSRREWRVGRNLVRADPSCPACLHDRIFFQLRLRGHIMMVRITQKER